MSEFRDTTNLTKWTIRFLYLQLVLSIIVGGNGALNIQRINKGIYSSEADLVLMDIVIVAWGLVFFITGFMILRWIYLTSQNSHLISSDTMEFSPGWAVGWYFVPIALLWKPYQAMKEIWMINVSDTIPSIYPWWWFFWILTNFLANAAGYVDANSFNNVFDVLANATNVPLCLIFITIMNQIYQSQKLKVIQKETTEDADFD